MRTIVCICNYCALASTCHRHLLAWGVATLLVSNILHIYTDFPGILFWDEPMKERITPQGATIQSPDTGIFLSVPEQALSSEEKDVDILVHPCFSCVFELPVGYESTSPAYLIQPSRKVDFQKDITLQIQHYASLESEEDSEEMMFLSASSTPQYRDSKPVYVFQEIQQSKEVFGMNGQVGEIALRHFSLVKTGRRRKARKRGAVTEGRMCMGSKRDKTLV